MCKKRRVTCFYDDLNLTDNFLLQIVYSSSYETVVDFTRDYDLIRQALGKVEHYDKTCLETVLHAINNRFQSTWGVQNYCQVSKFLNF